MVIKTISRSFLCYVLDTDSFRQLIVDVVTTILDGYCTAAFAMCNDRDCFAGIAAEGKQERVQLFVIGYNFPDDVFLSFCGFSESHVFSPRFI